MSREYDLTLGDFPNANLVKSVLPDIDLMKLPKLDQRRIDDIDEMLSVGIPALMKLLPNEEVRNAQSHIGNNRQRLMRPTTATQKLPSVQVAPG